MKQKKIDFSILFLGICLSIVPSLLKGQDKDVSEIVKEELDREFGVLGSLTPSVYYMVYRLDDTKSWSLQGAFGSAVLEFFGDNNPGSIQPIWTI